MGTGTLGLHRARFARHAELKVLYSATPHSESVLLGTKRLFLVLRRFVSVRPTPMRREIGNLLVVAPTRGGKGLLATSQLLSWQHSVIVNEIKGDLFTQTAGYRATLGKVFVIDPTGVGHCYDPLAGKHIEDELYSSASHLLFEADETERIFTQRAIVMLTQLFLAARYEGIPPLVYVRFLIRLGLADAASRLNHLDPDLATQFLDTRFELANLTDRFFTVLLGNLSSQTAAFANRNRCPVLFALGFHTGRNHERYQTSDDLSSLERAGFTCPVATSKTFMGNADP